MRFVLLPGSVAVTALALVALAGLVLVWLGVRGRRVGGEPRCRRCGYELTGLGLDSGSRERAATPAVDAAGAAPRCPECGASTTNRRAVVRGRRVTRVLPLLAGASLVLVGCGPLIGLGMMQVRGYDWRKLLPTGAVIEMLRQPGSSSRWAWGEISRRRATAPLSAGNLQRLAEVALDEQRKAQRRSITDELLGELDGLYRADLLSRDQKRRLAQQAVRDLELHVPETIPVGMPCPFRIEWLCSGPRLEVTLVEIRTGTSAVAGGGRVVLGGSGLSPATLGSQVPQFGPGAHDVTVRVRATLFPDLSSPPGPLPAGEWTLTSTVRVTASDPAGIVEQVCSATMDEAVRARLVIFAGQVMRDTAGQLSVTLHAEAGLPVAVAFDVFLEADGVSAQAGTLAIAGGNAIGAGRHIYADGLPASLRDVATVDVRLRSSWRAAIEGVVGAKIWRGELLFEDLAVTPTGSAPPSGKHRPVLVSSCGQPRDGVASGAGAREGGSSQSPPPASAPQSRPQGSAP